MQALHGTRAASSVTAANSQLARSPSSLTRMSTTACPAMRTSSPRAAHAVKRWMKLCMVVKETMQTHGETWVGLIKQERAWEYILELNLKDLHVTFDLSYFQALAKGGVTYRDEPWHKECFVCTSCKTQLAGQHFTSRDENPYCLKCFGSLYAKKCEACSKPITGKITSLCSTR